MTEKNHFDGEIYAEHFRAENNTLPNADVSWLNELRQTSLDQFEQIGIPGPKVEEWKYTNLALLKSQTFEIPSIPDAGSIDTLSNYSLGLNGPKVVFIDGYFNSDHSEIEQQSGITIASTNEFIKKNPDQARAFLSESENEGGLEKLNLAMMTGGYVITLDEDIKLTEPIEIIHFASKRSTSKALRTRNFIQLSKNSEAKIVESFYGENAVEYWRQNNTNISLQEKSFLEIYQVQQEGGDAIHMGHTEAGLSESAEFHHYSINLGSKISRTEIKPTLLGLHGNVELRGAFMGRDGNSHDVMTHMKHMVPECESDQIYRGVLDKGGKSAFQGKVYVAKDAQLTNADQSNKNLILDRSAEANSKPELLIYADDVKCSHGATVGELDQDALFYLKSRGLDEAAAKALLVEAFVNEVFEDVSIDQIKEKYLELAGSWLDEDASS